MVKTSHFALHQLRTRVEPATGPEPEKAQVLFAFASSRWGILIPKRWARRAVTRNLIRRQVRQLVHASEKALPASDYVLRLKTAFDAKCFRSAASSELKQAVRLELQQLFAKIGVH